MEVKTNIVRWQSGFCQDSTTKESVCFSWNYNCNNLNLQENLLKITHLTITIFLWNTYFIHSGVLGIVIFTAWSTSLDSVLLWFALNEPLKLPVRLSFETPVLLSVFTGIVRPAADRVRERLGASMFEEILRDRFVDCSFDTSVLLFVVTTSFLSEVLGAVFATRGLRLYSNNKNQIMYINIPQCIYIWS